MTAAGDLGRRVAERRHALGLSEEEVAERASMHPAYLEMVEHSAAPQLTRSAFLRLAAALETTVEALSGAAMLAPPGGGERAPRHVLETLCYDECQQLISQGGIGRVVYLAGRGPVALPVNFKMLGGDVVFRTEPSSSLRVATEKAVISFEVDRIDDALGEGWSVLLTGEGRAITEPKEQAIVESLDISPWAEGNRDVYVRIAPNQVTGRRIRAATESLSEPPGTKGS